MRIIIVCLMLAFSLTVLNCGSDNTLPAEEEIEGEYLFVEMWIFSSAKEISGDCDYGDNPHTGPDYIYDPNTQIFEYTRSPEFPVNEQLKIIFGGKHQFNPLAGVGGTVVTIVPVYFIPDWLTGNVYVEAILPNNKIVLQVNYKSFEPPTMYLTEDSVFVHVIKTIEEGVGDSCIWEYTDSLVITNYGLNPKSKITYKPFPKNNN